MKNNSPRFYKEKAAAIRTSILKVSHRARTPHIGSALSIVEILTVLYFRILNVKSHRQSGFEMRDRLILSKGHAGLALYAALAERGILKRKFLDRFVQNGTMLPSHPSRNVPLGVEVTTGSLGHGLPMAVGLALAAKRDKKPYRVFVIISDGECDEGSTWEAIMAAGQWHLDNLTVIVDYNKIQSFGRVREVMDLEPLAAKWKSFRWSVKEADGHDMGALIKTLSKVPFRKNFPSVLIAHTVKGKGVSFMEDTIDWHYKNLTDVLLDQAIKEINHAR
ncbi:MAG: transketolase [Candidatus Liptonbacteria bacterium RIFCSPLOWO2_01_FULL_53_13]|uniref:Transketolase n=1 Tax=Candidatus Liptonbacteria bacterium RIFCSPLOWO2_01_FULL_53_13 TaxID=1798651 RepID=A0A1G2CLN9_9BACT|nr:MAG: transketolase [Candidatus Liptonbacteria bacterium RIFCSPLOWO2_01_FULL_53_13]